MRTKEWLVFLLLIGLFLAGAYLDGLTLSELTQKDSPPERGFVQIGERGRITDGN